MRGLNDLRQALRSVSAAPGILGIATVTLAIGTATIMLAFAVVDATLLKDLPYPNGARLVEVWTAHEKTGLESPRLDTRLIGALGRAPEVFRAVGAYEFEGVTVTAPGPAQMAAAARVSPSLLVTLGAVPIAGRVFTAEDAASPDPSVALIAESMWRARFGARHDIAGTSLWIEGRRHSIVGVMPSAFRFPETSTEVWRPLPGRSAEGVTAEALAMLADGVSAEAADARLRTLSIGLRKAGQLDREVALVTAEPIQRRHNRRFSTSLYALFAGAALLHLVACLNVASLLLVRTTSRERLLAVSAALGARSRDLISLVAFEAVLICVPGCAAGAAAAAAAVRLIRGSIPTDYTWLASSGVTIDARVLVFGACVACLSCLLVGAFPVARVLRLNVASVLQRAAATHTGARRLAAHGAVVICQLALALVLLATGGLLLESFMRLASVDPGFDVSNLLVFELQFPDSSSRDARVAFTEELQRRISAVPHVVAASYSAGAPPRGGDVLLKPEARSDGGPPLPEFAQLDLPSMRVTADYFHTMRVPLAGRTFGADSSSHEVVVNDILARRVWRDRSAIGHQFEPGAGWGWYTVVGVAKDVKVQGLDDSMGEGMEFYTLAGPDMPGFRTILVRTDNEAAIVPVRRQVGRAIAELAPQLPVLGSQTMQERLQESLDKERFLVSVASLFAGVGLLLSALGVFGAASYWVISQRRELAIRLAVGGTPNRILALVLRRGARMAIAGTVLGIAIVLSSNRLLVSLLFQVQPSDALSCTFAIAILWAAVFGATYIPAHIASRIDPAVTLRND